MKYLAYIAGIIFCVAQVPGYAAHTDSATGPDAHTVAQALPVEVSFADGNWEIHAKNSQVESYLGQSSLFLEEGNAILQGVAFRDGILEYDVAFSEERGFIGSAWHIQDDGNYEEFYIRAHQSGNPDANQYTPVFNALAGWQLYYGEDYSAPITYSFNQWMRIKIVMLGESVMIYIGDMEKPAVSTRMKHLPPSSGGVSLNVTLGKAHFANVRYQDLSKGAAVDSTAFNEDRLSREPNAVNTWLVSQAFSEDSLDHTVQLTPQNKDGLTWQPLATDKALSPGSGTTPANLARVQGIEKDSNTVFARFTVISGQAQVKALQFGFSDRVKVYLNDTLMYAGDNTYRSRDYRFLGTIGFFDTLYLPLEKGPNEVWMAVSESFGGWGVQAQFIDTDDISIEP